MPRHWQVRRLGSLGRFSASGIDKEIVRGQPLVKMVNYLDVYNNVSRQLDASRDYQVVSCSTGQREVHAVKCGDMLFTPSSETANDIGISAVCNEDIDNTVYSYHVIRFRPESLIYLEFRKYLCNNGPVLNQFSAAAKGTTRLILTRPDFRSVHVVVPPLPEQRAVVRFLDYVDQRINRLIDAKKKLVELLEELQTAFISEAITGRIDVGTGLPYPVYKDSGVEWIGRIPAHWDVSRVKAEFECLNHRRIPLNSTDRGKMTQRTYDYYGASGVIDKVDGYLFDDDLLLIAEDGANLILRNSPLAIVARGKFWVNNHAHILKPRRGHLQYLADVMEGLSYLPWISGAAQPKLTRERLMSIAIAVPPLVEQERIISYKADRTGSLKKAIVQTGREVSLLSEYRARLIADVVTGKIDVRGALARLEKVNPQGAADESDDVGGRKRSRNASPAEPVP